VSSPSHTLKLLKLQGFLACSRCEQDAGKEYNRDLELHLVAVRVPCPNLHGRKADGFSAQIGESKRQRECQLARDAEAFRRTSQGRYE